MTTSEPGLAALRVVLAAAATGAPVAPDVLDAAQAALDAVAGNMLPVGDVAAQLRVSVDTVRRLIAQGHLTAVHLGYRTVRVSAGSLARLIAAS